MNKADEAVIARYSNLRYRGIRAQPACGPSRILCAHGDNPFCGDTLDISLTVDTSCTPATIQKARYDGYGCSLCLSCADLLMELIEGKTIPEASAFDILSIKEAWGGLEVSRSRESCVSLPVRVLHEALAKAAKEL